MHGRWAFQVENALAAIAAAHALGISSSHISEGLTRAGSTVQPRFSRFQLHGATVVLSMCRNLSALDATLAALAPGSGSGPRNAVYGVYADQSADAVREQGVTLGGCFSEVLCGFGDSAAEPQPQLLDELVQAIQSTPGGCTATRAQVDLHADATLQNRMSNLSPGQLLLIQVPDLEVLTRTAKFIVELGGATTTDWPTPLSTTSSLGRESKRAQSQSNVS
jgi:cyanophycin synthetase